MKKITVYLSAFLSIIIILGVGYLTYKSFYQNDILLGIVNLIWLITELVSLIILFVKYNKHNNISVFLLLPLLIQTVILMMLIT